MCWYDLYLAYEKVSQIACLLSFLAVEVIGTADSFVMLALVDGTFIVYIMDETAINI